MTFTLFLFVSLIAGAQKIQLINSGEVIQEARALLDSGKNAEAIQRFLMIPKQDTNYVYMQKELAFAYLANSEYDKCIAVAEKALGEPSEYRAEFMRARASSTARKGDFDRALVLYTEAIRDFPTDISLRYSLAITYYNKSMFDKATEQFFQVLAVNPFHNGSHLHLGLMAIRQGRKVHGMFAMGMYVALAPSDNRRLSLLNNFLDNAVTDEGQDSPIGPSVSDKLDQIIRARIAMEEGFNSAIPIKAAVVRQYELLFGQLQMIPASNDNPWTRLYLPVFQAIQRQKSVEAFIYHLMTSSPNEVAKKWRAKNDDQLKAFFELANTELKKQRERVSMPGFSGPVMAWYDNSNNLEALGEQKGEEVRTGKWVVYFENGERRASGEYNTTGEKIGTWTYGHSNGKVKSIENYTTGEVTVYAKDGTKAEYFYLKGDDIHGAVETYFPCGQVREKMNYVSGKRQGKYEAFYADGTLWRTYSYTDGKADGEFRKYHANGTLASHEYYKQGVSEGPYVEYYPTGKKQSEGAFHEDAVSGEWKYYHPNGQLSRTGRYSDKGFGIGEWLYYDWDGTLNERRAFDNEGNRHGENQFFHNGRPHYTITYKKDLLIKSVSYSEDSKILGSYGRADGTFACKYFYSTGELLSEGNYVKGKREGHWKFYSRFGKLTSEADYLGGMVEGTLTRYHPSGAIREKATYKGDELNGYLVSYHPNGQLEQEGWFQSDKRQQQWLTYRADGTLEYDYYYLNGELLGETTDYAIDGKPHFIAIHDPEIGIKSIRPFSEKGEVPLKKKQDGWKTIFEDQFENGGPREQLAVGCGKYNGEVTRWYPDGTKMSVTRYKDGEREGLFEYWEMDGTRSLTGSYVGGSRTGRWRQHHENGKLYSEGVYVEGERDSTWTYYYGNGNKSSESRFVNGKRHGVSRYFGPEGSALLEKKFDEGDMTHFRLLSATGTPGEWIRFNGTGKVEARYPDGVMAWMEEFKDGTRHGHQVIYYPNGKVFSDVAFEYDNYSGPLSAYYPNGQIMERATNVSDERQGLTEQFREDGKPFLREMHHLGIRQGESATYDEKGNVKKAYHFWNGIPQR